jgi:hypothetical protein
MDDVEEKLVWAVGNVFQARVEAASSDALTTTALFSK